MSGTFRPFAGLAVAVVGLGRAGLPAALRLAEWGAEVTAWDDGLAARQAAEAAGVTVADMAQGPFRFDALLLSPGIPHRLPVAHPIAARAEAGRVPILCDVEFLAAAIRASGQMPLLAGITGTNGKSTTTALLQHILAGAGWNALAGGNLGTAALSMPLLPTDGAYVLEMSSYMLERLARTRFNAAVMLNLSPDHLDRHGSMAGYAAAKAQIFARQDRDDIAVLGQDDVAAALGVGLAARKIPISGRRPQPGGVWAEAGMLRDDAGLILPMAEAPTLPGEHNAQNAAAAAAVALAWGLAREAVAEGLRTYPGLPHRAEQVAFLDGIPWINDSKATNADSTARALASWKHAVLIAGGTGKEGGIEPLIPLFGRIAHAVLIGRDAPVFAATLAAQGVPHTMAGTLAAAIPAARDAARATGAEAVLLSPAAASWDQFTGFDARGDAFRAAVQALAQQQAAETSRCP